MRIANLGRWLSDRTNPIVVKEIRQAVKSKTFIGLYDVALLVCLAISLIACGSYAQQDPTKAMGDNVFYALLACLWIAGVLLMPLLAFHGMSSERTDNAYDLLNVSGLSPGRIVRGKLLALILELSLIYSAFVPFMAFAFFLRGIDVPEMLGHIAVSFIAAVFMLMFALAAGTLGSTKRASGIIGLIFFVIILILFLFLLPYLGMLFYRPGRAFMSWGGSPGLFVQAAITTLTTMGTFFVLFYLLAVSRLTFAAGNRSTPMRIALTLQTLIFAGLCLYVHLEHPDDDNWVGYGIKMAIWWGFLGLFLTGESDQLSRRVQASVPRRAALRLFVTPFWPGSSRGWAYLTLNLFIVMAVTYVGLFMYLGGSLVTFYGRVVSRDEFVAPATIASYALIYLGVASVLFRTILRKWRTPAAQRVTVLIVIAVTSIVPGVLDLVLDRRSYEPAPYRLLGPVSFLMRRENYSLAPLIWAVALLVVFLHLRVILGGFSELWGIAAQNAKRRLSAPSESS